MRDFNTLSPQEKQTHHEKLLACANSFGGKNFFLLLLESIREAKSHPLTSAQSIFHIDIGSVSWNKAIFPATLSMLIKARVNEGEQDNLLPDVGAKNYKKILNITRTLRPIVFTVKPSNPKEGSGFFFQAFDIIDDKKTKLNPVFDAVFFSSVESVKKILNYKAKD